MEGVQFLFVEDLVEEQRNEIDEILFYGKRVVIEFSITLEKQKNRPQGVVQTLEPIVDTSSLQNAAALHFNSGIPIPSNAFRQVFMPPQVRYPPVVHDGQLSNGAPMHSITPALVQGQHPYFYFTGTHQRPVLFSWSHSQPFAVSTSAAGTSLQPPFYIIHGQQPILLPTASTVQNSSASQSNMNGGEIDTQLVSDVESTDQAHPSISDRKQQVHLYPGPESNVADETRANSEPTQRCELLATGEATPLNSPEDNSPACKGDNYLAGGHSEDQTDVNHKELGEQPDIQNEAAPPASEETPTAIQSASTQEVLKAEDAKAEKGEQKTWASLFRNTRSANEAIVTTVLDYALDGENSQMAIHKAARESAGMVKATQDSRKPLRIEEIWVPVERDPPARTLADVLKTYVFVDRGPTYVMRGMTNRGNWCYVNATLQALMACPPFFQFLRHLNGHIKNRLPSSTPLLDAFTKLASEYPLVRDFEKKIPKNQSPLDLSYMHSIISELKTDASFKGHQEDAEEFLLFVLNRLHEEMAAVLTLLDTDKGQRPRTTSATEDHTGGSDNIEWNQVGTGKKVTVTRHIRVAQSPIMEMFAGQLRYGLNCPGAKDSANIEPFFTLPLDVLMDNVKDIHSALRFFTKAEILKSRGHNRTEVDATRRVTFSQLPRVLIFQLKYFEFSYDGVKKNIKPFEYPMDLAFSQDYLSYTANIPHRDRLYKLFAVLFHHGEKAEGGHYTVDVFHGGQWINVDDTKATPVNKEHVFSFQAPRVPYLIFYRRFELTNMDQSSHRRDGDSGGKSGKR